MAQFTHEQVLAATGSKAGSGPGSYTGVSTDSRTAAAGQLFVALVGEKFDGHAFLADVAGRGVRGAIVQAGKARPAVPAGFVLYEVPDSLRALGALAQDYRRRFSIPVGAVGGSNGKTTTKDMVAAILATRGPALATEGNFNNEIGVPLTLFRLAPEHQSAVIELGMNHPGEVERLTAMVEPQAGLITVVQPEHLEGLGSLENVAHAEGELYRGLPQNGIAVANIDDPLAYREAVQSGRKLITFGRAARAEVRLLGIDQHDAQGMRFRIGFRGEKELNVTVSHVGEHNALNACGALALTTAMGFTPEQAVQGLARAVPVSRRLNLRKTPSGMTVIDDCYNANPGSMVAALETLRVLARGGGRPVAILGDMLELGAEEREAHRRLGDQAAAAARVMLFFGPRSRAACEAAELVTGIEVYHYAETEADAAVALLKQRLRPGDVVLVKGSRGMRMERIVAGLMGEAVGAPH